MSDTFGAPTAEYVGDGYVLRFEYDDEVKDALKNELHTSDRRWSPEHEGWFVAAAQFHIALGILHRRWREVLVTGEDGGDYVVHRDGTRTAQGSLF